MIDKIPVLGICGWSGSGKTTLIEAVLSKLVGQGLKVAVLKHDVHGIDVDRPGKDSDRFFRAGADVILQGSEELVRLHPNTEIDLISRLKSLSVNYDLILVEGHKRTPLPKVWLLGEGETQPPPVVEHIRTVLARDSKRIDHFMDFLTDWLPGQWLKIPVYACVVAEHCDNQRKYSMSRLSCDQTTDLKLLIEELKNVVQEVVVTVAGSEYERIPGAIRLPAITDINRPLGELLAAMRWNPFVSWLVVERTAEVNNNLWQRLLSFRTPGVWAISPKSSTDEKRVFFPAYYDFRSHSLLEKMATQKTPHIDKLHHAKIITPFLSE